MNMPNVLWMSSLLEGKLYKMDRNWSKRQWINYVFIMWSMIFPHHPLWLLQKNAGLLELFHFLSALSLRMAALNRGGSDIFFKEADKICTLQTNLAKVPDKKWTLRTHFAKSTDKNLRVRIPVTFGGADKKWNVPYGLPLFKAVFPKAPYTVDSLITDTSIRRTPL